MTTYIYDGSETYDFTGELGSAKARAATLQTQRKEAEAMAEAHYWQAFAAGGLYRETTFGTGRPAKTRPIGKIVAKAPTAEELHKHAAKFGPAGVAEVAALYGINMQVRKAEPKPARRRRTTVDLKGKVLELKARGLVPAAIADALNVSDRRVTTILRSAAA